MLTDREESRRQSRIISLRKWAKKMDINERKALSFGAFSVCGSLGKVEGGRGGGGGVRHKSSKQDGRDFKLPKVPLNEFERAQNQFPCR